MDVLLERCSVRTFEKCELSIDDLDSLKRYINDDGLMTGPCGTRVRVEFRAVVDFKLGTYGVIRNAPGFLIAVCEKGRLGYIDCGYVLERLFLFLAGLGVGTCFMAGTYKKSDVMLDVLDSEVVAIVSPVGYAAKRRAFGDVVIRGIAKSHRRFEYGDLFYLNDFGCSLSEFDACLERVRLAPSSSNKQPWRVVKVDGRYDLYLVRTKNYEELLEIDCQMVDMGIALCHLTYGCEFELLNVMESVDGFEYVFSVILKGSYEK